MIDHARNKHSSPQLFFHQLDIEEDNENILKILYEKLFSQNNNEENDEEVGLQRIMPERQSVDNKINDGKLEDHGVNGYLEKEVKKLSIYHGKNGTPHNEAWCKEDSQVLKETINVDNRFDIVFSFYCLHWIQNQRQALKNIYAMLKPGGEALITLLAKSSIYTMYERVSEVPEWSVLMKDVKKYISPYQHSNDPVKEISELASDIGFNPVLIECRSHSFSYRNLAHLTEAIEAVNPFCPRLSEDQREAYLSDCLKIVEQCRLADITDQGVNVYYKLLVAHLRR